MFKLLPITPFNRLAVLQPKDSGRGIWRDMLARRTTGGLPTPGTEAQIYFGFSAKWRGAVRARVAAEVQQP
jgi:hypothetical protein